MALRQTAPVPIDQVSWEEFSQEFVWEQGQHMGIVGPTGLGKSHLTRHLLGRRDYIVACVTKAKDPTWEPLKKTWNHLDKWPIGYWPTSQKSRKVLLWPKPEFPSFWQLLVSIFTGKELGRIEFENIQGPAFRSFLNDAFQSGGWCIVLDEMRYVNGDLKLRGEINRLLLQGRTGKVSLVCGSQRPYYIPLEVYDQATHLFFFRDTDETNLRRVGGIGWLNKRSIMRTVAELPPYHFLYVNTRTGFRCVSSAPEDLPE